MWKDVFTIQNKNKEYAERMMGLIVSVDSITSQISALKKEQMLKNVGFLYLRLSMLVESLEKLRYEMEESQQKLIEVISEEEQDPSVQMSLHYLSMSQISIQNYLSTLNPLKDSMLALCRAEKTTDTVQILENQNRIIKQLEAYQKGERI